jgi:hypothetical protein
MTDEKDKPKTILDEELTKIIQFTPEESKRIGSTILAEMKNNPTETGANLLHLAQRRTEKIFMESVLNRVQELVSHRNQLFIALEKTQREIALFDKRIAAVQAGEFTIDYNGRLKYNDILLNY